jgi:hypothetical protein
MKKISVKKDGNYYRVFEGRKRIGSFLIRLEAEKYAESRGGNVE